MALLALVAGQDVEPVEGSDGTDGHWRIAQKVAPDRVISTVDPDARHAHKTVHRRQDGFKAHLAIEPDTGIITDCTLTKAAVRITTKPSSGWPYWTTSPARCGCSVIRPTAPVPLALRSPRPSTPRSSNRYPCAPRYLAGSLPTTSLSISRPVP
ncbi:hypothetical protein [Mycolicibacterium agri]|uniref:hypothetical protein n=1 Tax=Mycolicibacterium agri TaxID=36811 RepID=UPI003530B51E